MNVLAAILYFIASSVLIGLALGFQSGALDPHGAVLSLAGGFFAAAGCWCCGPKNPTPLPRPRGWEWVPVVLFALFALRAFLWLIFRDRDSLRVLSPNNLGDMSLHLTFINYLKNGAPLWPDSPIFANGKTAYALGMDFFNGLLALVGFDVIHGLVLVGLVCALLAGIALWRWGGGFTLMAFLANGTLIGFACFAATPDESFFRDYTGYQELDSAWKSLPLALLVTQRGFLYALPAGLALLCSWRTRFFLDGAGWRMPFAGELLLYAAMPFFHVHTFIALSFLLACFFVVRAAARWRIAALVGAAFVPATVLLYFTIGMFKANALPMWEDMAAIDNPPPRPAAEILGWQPGWEVNDEPTRQAWTTFAAKTGAPAPLESHGRFLIFWLGNFGLWPFLSAATALTLLATILHRRIPAYRAWLAGLAALLITPVLGWSAAYQTGTFAHFLLGTNAPGPGEQLSLILFILAALATAVALRRAKPPLRSLRWILFAFVAFCATDGLLAGGRMLGAQVPALRANAVPLIMATLAFLWVLIRIAQRWAPPLWPAAFVFPGLFLFFVCCNVKFAPWAWDNTKMMLWAYLAVVPFAWDLVLSRWNILSRTAAALVLFLPGTVILLGGIGPQHHGFEIARISEVDAVAEAVREIPVTATFAAEPTYNHPLLINGRKLSLGYIGHLDSHGIQFNRQLALLDSLMNGGNDWRIAAAKLGARYLFFGPRERERWPASLQGWRGAHVIASGQWGELFDLETPPVPPARPQR